MPPSQWQTGIVTDLHPGDDGFARVVSLRMGDATVKRPITKIGPFPTDKFGKTITTNFSKINYYKMKSFNVVPMIMALSAIYSPLVGSMPVDNTIHVSKFETPPGLYFEKMFDAYVTDSKWNLVAFVDLEKINENLKHLYNQSSEVESVCKKRFEIGNSCEQWVNMIHQRMSKLQDEFEAISSSQGRSKRAVLNLVGDIAGDIFGILGSKFEKEYRSNTDKLMTNDKHLLSLIKNQTTVIENTMNILKKNENELVIQNEYLRNTTIHIENIYIYI